MPTEESTTQTTTQTTTQEVSGDGKTTTPPASFEEYLKGQPKEVQDLYETHVTGLKHTVDATRKERDEFSRQLRDAAKSVEKGSKLEGQLTDLATKLEEANARANFYEVAPSMECKNPKVAFAVMTSLQLTTRSGEPDWKAIKEAAPELFGKVSTNASAGSGTLQQEIKTDPHAGMNDFIRRKGQPQ